MKTLKLILLSAIAIAFITACDNMPMNEEMQGDVSITIAEDEISALKSEESAEQEINTARFASNFPGYFTNEKFVPRYLLGVNFPECAEVTVEGETFPKTIKLLLNLVSGLISL